MPNECKFCNEYYPFDIADTTKLVERSLDDYAYVGVRVWITEGNVMRVFAVTDKNKTFAVADCSAPIKYCPMCGRQLRGADNG